MSGSVYMHPSFTEFQPTELPNLSPSSPQRQSKTLWSFLFPMMMTPCPEIQIACTSWYTHGIVKCPWKKVAVASSFCLPGILIPHPQCFLFFLLRLYGFLICFLFVGLFQPFWFNLNDNTGFT